MTSTVFITGATDGIGLALARRYHAEGARLLLVGRRPLAALDEALFCPATYCQADLAQPDAARTVQHFLDSQGVRVLDIAVQNAAIGQYGAVADDGPASIAAQVAVNLAAPIALTHLLHGRLQRGRGKVVFISSVVEAIACADFAVYAATKAALDGFARSLRLEWRGRIGVQVVHPGAVRTAFHEKACVPPELVRSPRIPTAEVVAAEIQRLVRGTRLGPTLGVKNRLARFAGRRFARPLDWVMRRSRA